jgi:hypothetical protein
METGTLLLGEVGHGEGTRETWNWVLIYISIIC